MTDVSNSVISRVKAYENAWNTHNSDDIVAFFTEDADMVMGNSPIAVGRDAIRDWWEKYFGQIHSTRIGVFTIDSMRIISPEVVLLNIESTTSGFGPGGDILPERKARGTWILTKSTGDWLISALRGLPAEGDSRVSHGTDH